MIKKLGKIILALIVITVGCSDLFAERITVDVGQFQKLKINGNLRVVYKNVADSTGMARYDSPDGNRDIFKFSNKNEGLLKVEPQDDNWGLDDLPLLYLYSDFLTSIESFSDKNVEVSGLNPCASLTVNQIGNGSISVDNLRCNNVSASITTGNGSIYLSGSCINANFRMVGTGLISADQLKAENIKCRILGTGSIGCWPIDNLKVTGLGSTKIYYKGKPNIKKTGGGKLFELPDEMDEEAYSRLGTEVKSFSLPVPVEDEEESEEDDYETVVTEDD